MTYRYEPGRWANGHSRPTGSPNGFEHWRREREVLVFEASELVLNPWDHIIPIPEEERVRPFGFANQFGRGSQYIFHRDGREYHIHFGDIQH